MTTHVELRRGTYHDSVSLMQVSRSVAGTDGVTAAQVAMATELNVEVLTGMGFDVPEGAGANDLVLAVRGIDDAGVAAGLAAVDDVLANLADEQLYKLLLRLRDWNTNVRTAPIAQKILWTVVKSYPASRLASLRPKGKVGTKGSLRDVLDAIRAYSERHYKRVEELVDESYLLDFTLREMDEVGDVKAITNGTGRLGLERDVVMAE